TSPANPKYRKWGDNETLSWEYSLPPIPNVQTPGSQSFYKMACSPTKNEAILVFVSSVTDSSLYCRIFVYRFDGSTWSVVASEGVAQLFNSGYLDIAYEQKSGRGILAYKKGNAAGASAILYYRIWDGNQWSSEQQAGSVNEGFINYVKLYPKPETDEIIAVVVSGSVPRCVYTFVWDGNSWQSGVRIVNCATAATYQPFDAAYEGRLKKFVLLVSSSSGAGNARYVVWDSTGWTQEQPIVFPYLTSYPCWIKAAAKPSSDEIVFVANSTSGVISAMVWNGTTWGSFNLLTSNSGILNQHSRPFDVAYEQNSGYAVVVYGDANYIGTPRYVRYHTSSGWSSPSSANSVGSTLIRWISLQPIKNTNQILMLCSDSETTPDLNFQRWDGASWKNLIEIETETSSRESFVMRLREDLYYIKDTTAPAAVTDLSGDVLAEGTVKLNWSTPGDDNWSGVLPCGSRYKIVYSTVEPTNSELTWPATYSILIATYGVSSPQKQFFVISGLPYETTWYFRLRTRDEAGNWSELSNACTLYVVVRPAAITSLSALPSRWGRCIVLSWIAPGDDGWMGDIVDGRYRIRYSTYVLPSADFWDTGSWSDFQNKFEIEWSTNTSPYSAQRRRLTGLLPGVTYYIRIWTRDENPNNWSDISNTATSWAQWVIVGIDVKGYQELSWATTYNFDWLQTNTSSIAAYGLVIENTGNVYEDYGVRINTTSMKDDYNTTWTIDDSSSVWYDRFVLEGVFYNLRPATTDYGTNYSENDDVITSLTIWALEDSKYHP
ncbi:MAG: fibronectin type III domain-containing protein, partial [candidate division WOR-3 bacterium]